VTAIHGTEKPPEAAAVANEVPKHATPALRMPLVHDLYRGSDPSMGIGTTATISCRNKHAVPGVKCIVLVVFAVPLAIWYAPHLVSRAAAAQRQNPLLRVSDLEANTTAGELETVHSHL
jgi:hypothetical protein